jgi:hypothetical protein
MGDGLTPSEQEALNEGFAEAGVEGFEDPDPDDDLRDEEVREADREAVEAARKQRRSEPSGNDTEASSDTESMDRAMADDSSPTGAQSVAADLSETAQQVTETGEALVNRSVGGLTGDGGPSDSKIGRAHV